MTSSANEGLHAIRRALISVSDKTGIIEFARELKRFGIEIISTGGTAKVLREAGIDVRDVSEVTGFPEMMDGRIKTLHPRIHGALLALRDNPEHVAALSQHEIEPIDLVVVNLYPFQQTIMKENVTQAEAIEQIDIGGPAMIRSAAKNWQSVAVVVEPDRYAEITAELSEHEGSLSHSTRSELARRAFAHTAMYDATVSAYLSGAYPPTSTGAEKPGKPGFGGVSAATWSLGRNGVSSPNAALNVDSERFSLETFHGSLPSNASWTISKTADLRYGENPHQVAAIYQTSEHSGVANAELLSGKEMSFNNYVDADAAWQLVCDFAETACAIIKHTNPAGVGVALQAAEAYRKALATDPISAFGGIVAFNRPVDESAARAVIEIFTEVLIAPDYDADALELLRSKKNLRVLRAWPAAKVSAVEYKQISGGMLIQTRDNHRLAANELKVVTKRQPTEDEIAALQFAWTVCKHTKSNAIVYARNGQTVGVGAGQMSRVDSVKIGAMRAQLPVAGSVLASDAFFPFRDGLDEAARHGITAVIQPGGSVRDQEVIAAADEHNLAMVFTGIRHFKH